MKGMVTRNIHTNILHDSATLRGCTHAGTTELRACTQQIWRYASDEEEEAEEEEEEEAEEEEEEELHRQLASKTVQSC